MMSIRNFSFSSFASLSFSVAHFVVINFAAYYQMQELLHIAQMPSGATTSAYQGLPSVPSAS
jgi:hypothetical protein